MKMLQWMGDKAKEVEFRNNYTCKMVRIAAIVDKLRDQKTRTQIGFFDPIDVTMRMSTLLLIKSWGDGKL